MVTSLQQFLVHHPVYKLLPFLILGIILAGYLEINPAVTILLFMFCFTGLLTPFYRWTIAIIMILFPLVVLDLNQATPANFSESEIYNLKLEAADIQLGKYGVQYHLLAGETGFLLQTADSLKILPADSLFIKAKLFLPGTASNPGEFDYRAYLESKNIHYLIAKDFEILDITSGGESVNRWFYQLKEKIQSTVNSLVDEPFSGLAVGLLLGEKSGINPETREKFRSLGIIHILAVSGLHVGFVLLILMSLGKILPIPRTGEFIFIILGILLYMGITDWTTSVLRAGSMAILYAFGKFREKEVQPWNIVGVTAFAFLLVDPNQLFSLSFQLSFGAVVGILLILGQAGTLSRNFPIIKVWRQSGTGRWIMDALLVSIGAQLGTFLPLVMTFGEFPTWAFIVNLLVIPLTGISVITILISTLFSPFIPPIAQIFGDAFWGEMFIMDVMVQIMSQLPFKSISFFQWQFLEILILFNAFLLSLLFFCRRSFKPIFCVGFTVANIFVWGQTFKTADLEIIFLDVGQGDACVIREGENVILVDGGYSGFGRDYGTRVVVPFLKRQGIENINLTIMTHPHADHIGGIEDVIDEIEIEFIWDTPNQYTSRLYGRIKKSAGQRHISISHPQPGNQYQLGGMVITVLYPDSSLVGSLKNINDASLVFRLDYKKHSFLFTGDTERLAERIISGVGRKLAVDVIKIPHHGSRTSSSQSLINLTSPELGIISVGEKNYYGHPSGMIVQRWQDAGVQIFRTDKNGAVTVRTDGQNLSVNYMIQQ